MSMDKVVLNNGIEMPCLGMGTWQVTDRETLCCLVQEAGNLGYRMIDTAAAYGNEISLGKALFAETLRREEWFLTDKLWNTCRGYKEAIAACKKSMKKLKVDYLDAYLIHWPASAKLYGNWQEMNAETWRAMETLYREGYVRSIGVCNFKAHHLEALLKTAEVMPAIDQMELHPGFCEEDTVSYCREHHIRVEASSPLGNGRILENATLARIAERHEKNAGTDLSAAVLHLNNLIAILDANNIQKMSSVSDTIGSPDWEKKWTDFGWDVLEADGHDVADLERVLKSQNLSEKPRLIVAHTVKGKGVSLMENDPNWHFRLPNRKQLKAFQKELDISDEEMAQACREHISEN